MRKSVTLIFALLLLAAVGIWRMGQPTQAPEVDISIRAGMSARAIGHHLQQAGLIQHARYFEWLARWRGVTDQLEAGNYRLDGTASTGRLLDARGRKVVGATIPLLSVDKREKPAAGQSQIPRAVS